MRQLFSKYEAIGKVLLLPLHVIDPNPMQPRKTFDEEYIEELSRSIDENGLLQPITVRKKKDGRFELVAGECRLRATKMLEWQTKNIMEKKNMMRNSRFFGAACSVKS